MRASPTGPCGTEDGEDEDEGDDESADGSVSADSVPHGPVGDARILDDLGIGEKELRAMSDDALGEIAEALGAADVLETVR